MTHHQRHIERLKIQRDIAFIVIFMLLVCMVGYFYNEYRKSNVITPCAKDGCIKHVTYHGNYIDILVDRNARKYGKTNYQANRIKTLIHYLLLREQNYGGSNACGDSGKACGPLQFHATTYTSFRKIMMKKGIVQTMGDRLNMNDAIETCAWAISDGREKNWGPVSRGEIKI